MTSNSLMDCMKPETLVLSFLEPPAEALMAFLKVKSVSHALLSCLCESHYLSRPPSTILLLSLLLGT